MPSERTDNLSKGSKKQTFLGGAAVLALSAAIVKLIGALYKIPIQHVIGDDGYGYFNSAYDIYNVLLMIATTGLPVAMSRMISEENALQNFRQIRRIYDVSRRVFLLIGTVGTVGMAALCLPLADFVVRQHNAWFPILCLSPAVLLICLTSVNRGFFQGQGDMRPTSVSQVIEALCKLIVGLGLAVLIMALFRKGGLDTKTPSAALSEAHAWAAGGAIIGVTLGCGIAAWYLYGKVRRTEIYAGSDSGAVKSYKATTKELLRIAVPITIGAAGLQLINLADVGVYMGSLQSGAGMADKADVLKGIYNFCQTIFNLPCSFITPIVVAAIPALTEKITTKDRRGERSIMESALRVMALLACPSALGLAALSREIYALLASHTEETLATATPLLAILGICVIFNAIVLVTNGIMQSHGDVTIPVIHMLIGGGIKLFCTWQLVSIPRLNIVGASISTLICYVVISALNLFAMARKGYAVSIPRTMLKPLIASVLMGAITYGCKTILVRLQLSNLLVTALSICLAVAVYAVLVLALRIITKEDCALLPKGDKIARLLKIR